VALCQAGIEPELDPIVEQTIEKHIRGDAIDQIIEQAHRDLEKRE